jgi:hypothetical protein
MAKAGRRRSAKARGGRPADRPAASPDPRPGASGNAEPDGNPEPGRDGHLSEQELVAAAIGAAVQAVADGSRDRHGPHLDPLAIERAPGWTETVSRTIVGYLKASVTAARQRGWQPAELARHVGRELSADHAAMTADMITAELLRYPAAAVDPRWAAQAAALESARPGRGAWWGSDGEYLRAWYRLGRDAEFIGTVATAVETLQALRRLPALERLLPLPGTGRAAGPERAGGGPEPASAELASAGPVDERMLGRIRSLLAKAESTEFPEEAEALSARAQQLMATYSIDHALLAAESGRPDRPGARRIPVDNPYEAQKTTLLQIVAEANRCQVVWSRELGLVTVIGFPADLDVTELLFTSLLVQADAAMLRTGGKPAGGQPTSSARSKAFRQSFLLSYAVRIGERLSAAAGQAEREAIEQAGPDGGTARSGAELVPFLAARHRAVDDAVQDMFGSGLTRGRSVRATDADGWDSGRAAADLARLQNRAPVAG